MERMVRSLQDLWAQPQPPMVAIYGYASLRLLQTCVPFTAVQGREFNFADYPQAAEDGRGAYGPILQQLQRVVQHIPPHPMFTLTLILGVDTCHARCLQVLATWLRTCAQPVVLSTDGPLPSYLVAQLMQHHIPHVIVHAVPSQMSLAVAAQWVWELVTTQLLEQVCADMAQTIAEWLTMHEHVHPMLRGQADRWRRAVLQHQLLQQRWPTAQWCETVYAQWRVATRGTCVTLLSLTYPTLPLPPGLPSTLVTPPLFTTWSTLMARTNTEWLQRIYAATDAHYVTWLCKRTHCQGDGSHGGEWRPCADIKLTAAVQTVLLGTQGATAADTTAHAVHRVACAALVEPTAQAKYRLWHGWAEDSPSAAAATIALSTTVYHGFDTPTADLASTVECCTPYAWRDALSQDIRDELTFTSWRRTLLGSLGRPAEIKMIPQGWQRAQTPSLNPAILWSALPSPPLQGHYEILVMAPIEAYFAHLPRQGRGGVTLTSPLPPPSAESVYTVLREFWGWWDQPHPTAARAQRLLKMAVQTYLHQQPVHLIHMDGLIAGLRLLLERAQLQDRAALQPF